jgi:endonuclease/exonuclease/phosphatase family metal-dependent hydrolase
MRVLTLNVWNQEGSWPQRLSLLQNAIQRLQPDLLGFQEILGLEQVHEICGEHYHAKWGGQPAERMGDKVSGIAVAARWPIRDHQQITLVGNGSAPGGVALRARIDAPHGTISFCCATTYFYLPHHGHFRERQMPELAQFAREGVRPDDYPPILVGDLNAPPDSAEIRYLKGLQSFAGTSTYFVDAWELAGDGSPGATWSRQNGFASPWLLPSRRIDYVFVGHPRLPGGAGLVENCEVVCNEEVNGVWPSDHFGVCATLRE